MPIQRQALSEFKKGLTGISEEQVAAAVGWLAERGYLEHYSHDRSEYLTHLADGEDPDGGWSTSETILGNIRDRFRESDHGWRDYRSEDVQTGIAIGLLVLWRIAVSESGDPWWHHPPEWVGLDEKRPDEWEPSPVVSRPVPPMPDS